MICAPILERDGRHADFNAYGPDVRFDVRIGIGVLVVRVRDGAESVRLRIAGPLLSATMNAFRG